MSRKNLIVGQSGGLPQLLTAVFTEWYPKEDVIRKQSSIFMEW